MRRLVTAVLTFVAVSPTWSQTLDAADAAKAFNEREALCDRDQSVLWGRSLCGPLLFVDPATRVVIANQDSPGASLQRQGDVFVGRLPASILIANTAVEWNGERWSMVQWPLPEQRAAREDLMIHESWHRIQDALGLPMRSPTEAHLTTALGRSMMRMEWRALAAALIAQSDAARLSAIRDALIFRAHRRESAPGAADLENPLELNEGLAEYTGRRLSGQDSLAIAASLRQAENNTSFARNFAYASGPAYGFLLDVYDPGWRRRVTSQSDLGEMLAAAADVAPPDHTAASAESAGRSYGLTEVDGEERAAAREHEQQATKWTSQLVRGPVLRLPFGSMKIRFDPNTVFPLPPHGTVYPSLQIIDVWGTLVVKDGALIDDTWSGVTVAAPPGGGATAEGWTLEPNPEWVMRPGRREGDFTIAKSDQ